MGFGTDTVKCKKFEGLTQISVVYQGMYELYGSFSILRKGFILHSKTSSNTLIKSENRQCS